MLQEAWTPLEWLALAERELLLFAAVFFLIGALDELAMDCAWFWLRITGRGRTARIERAAHVGRPLAGRAALLIPAWHEDRLIGDTIAHALAAWPQDALRVYVGCYRNDPATAQAIMAGAGAIRAYAWWSTTVTGRRPRPIVSIASTRRWRPTKRDAAAATGCSSCRMPRTWSIRQP